MRYTPIPNKPQVRQSTGIPHDNRKTPPKDSPVWELVRTLEDRAMRQKNGLRATIEQKPLGEFFKQFQAGLTGRAPGTLETYGSQYAAFLRWCAEHKLVAVSDISATLAMEYVDHLKASYATSTARSTLAVLKMALDDAKQRNHIAFEKNPFAVSIKGKPAEPKRPFTAEEIRKLLQIAEPDWLPMAVRIAYYTGARGDSVRAMFKEDIKFGLGTIYFRKSKTTTYAVPMHPDLAAYLQPLVSGTGPLFPLVQDKSRGYFATMFSTRAKNVGVTGTFHQFRHTFITLAAEAGVDKRITMQLANHADVATHDGYTHADAAKLSPEILKVKFA